MPCPFSTSLTAAATPALSPIPIPAHFTSTILARCKANGVTISNTIFVLCSLAWICLPTLSYLQLKNETPQSDQELYDSIPKSVSNKYELQLLESFIILNKFI